MDHCTNFANRNICRARHYLSRYRRGTDGATAIEFSIIALPFLAIIFGIMELALVFFTGSVLTQSIGETGRLVRVGAFQGCGSAEEFKTLICNRMNGLMDCEQNLRVDLVTAKSFQKVTLVDPGTKGFDPDNADGAVAKGKFDDTGPGEPVILRGTFYYPLILPNFMTRLENLQSSGRRVITVYTAFRNEPFKADGTCNATLRDELELDADDPDS